MLKQRIITAVILIGALIAALWFLNPFQLSLVFGGLVLLGAWEWANLSSLTTLPARLAYTALMALFLLGAGWLVGLPDEVSPDVIEIVCRAAFLWWLVAIALIKTYPRNILFWQPSPIKMLFGLLVLLPPWMAGAYLLYLPNGVLWLLLSILVVVLADVGAYFSGKAFGKNKLEVEVSPGKTWEGLLGGILVNFILALVLIFVANLGIAPGWILIMVMLPAGFSVVGDLFESMLKRQRGIKDSGTILPGHGGILDRIDGLTVAIPLFALIVLYSGVYG